MDRNGFRAEFFSEPDPGFTGQSIFMVTSIMTGIFATVIAGLCPPEAKPRFSNEYLSEARQCTILVAARRPGIADKNDIK
jgi:hypothetical protein